LRFTSGKDGSAYIIYLLDENEIIPEEIHVKGFMPAKGAKITMLGKKGSSLQWNSEGDFFKILVRESQNKAIPLHNAVVFKINQALK